MRTPSYSQHRISTRLVWVGGTYDNHNIGVFYDNGKWSIFNADGAAMPVGAAFDVLTV